jgi:putative membrane protein
MVNFSIMTDNTSQTIAVLRFPLIVAVVLLHTYIIDRPVGGVIYVPHGEYPLFDLFAHVYQSEFGNMSVPLFFFISGFLFFYGMKKFSWLKFGHKLKKRIHSLLIPFFIWNVVFMLFVALVNMISPSLLTFKKSFVDMTFGEIANCFWNLSQGLIPLWFIRDLMIINLFAPIIYILLKNKMSKLILFGFTILFLSQIFHYVPGIGMRCAYPYMLGAWFSINGKDFIFVLNKYIYPLTILLIILVGFDTYLWTNDVSLFALNRFAQIIGIMTIPLWMSRCIEAGVLKKNDFLSKGSFFVFVFHMFIIYIPAKLWVYMFPVNGWTATMALLFIPLLVAYFCLGVYKVLLMFMPKVVTIAMGERN